MSDEQEDSFLVMSNFLERVGFNLFGTISRSDVESLIKHSDEVFELQLNNVTSNLKRDILVFLQNLKTKEKINYSKGLFEHYIDGNEYTISAKPFFTEINFETKKEKDTEVEQIIPISTSIEFETVDGQMLRIGPSLFSRMTDEIRKSVVGIDDWKNFYVKINKLTNDAYIIEPHVFEVDIEVDDEVEEVK
jgi:hypothetical protein